MDRTGNEQTPFPDTLKSRNLTSDENYEKIYNSVTVFKPADALVVTVFRESNVLRLTTTIDS